MAVKLACLLGAFAASSLPANGQVPGRPGALPVPVTAPLRVPPPLPQSALTAAPRLQEQPKVEPPKGKPIDPNTYTVLPERDKIFVIYDDAQLEQIVMNTIRESEKKRGVKTDETTLKFPSVEDVSGGVPYQAKTTTYPPREARYEPLYLIHRRLHFEDKNTERYGWDMGIIQPLVSAATFYKDVLFWPNSLGAGFAHGFWDTNAGKCLPGSATPYMLYPPGLTITGTVAETVIVTGAAFVFP